MKVGEAGEAFFVLETEEDVPEELMTSPVVMATDVSTAEQRAPLAEAPTARGAERSTPSAASPRVAREELHFRPNPVAASWSTAVPRPPYAPTQQALSFPHPIV